MERACPGCGLTMPPRGDLTAHGYYNASPECWSVYTEVLAAEYGNAVIFGQVHQRTVDAYALQHAGGEHPDKSVDIHLAGLHLVLVRGVAPMEVAPLLHRIANHVTAYPHFEPPRYRGAMTIFDVALAAGDWERHIDAVRAWSAGVWEAWAEHQDAIAEFVAAQLDAPVSA